MKYEENYYIKIEKYKSMPTSSQNTKNWGCVCTSFAHLGAGSFPHSSSLKLSQIRWTALQSAYLCHRFWFRLRFGLGLGHSDTWNMFRFQPFHWSPGFMFRVIVLLEGEPLSRSQVFCSFQQAPSIFQSIPTNFPVPAEEKHPQNTILPPPCLAVMVFCHIWHLLPYVFFARPHGPGQTANGSSYVFSLSKMMLFLRPSDCFGC